MDLVTLVHAVEGTINLFAKHEDTPSHIEQLIKLGWEIVKEAVDGDDEPKKPVKRVPKAKPAV